MGCSTSLYFVMMLWTARAKLSVPPPGPAVAINSIGLTGCHAAFAAPDQPIARPQAIAENFDFRDTRVLPMSLFLYVFAPAASFTGVAGATTPFPAGVNFIAPKP